MQETRILNLKINKDASLIQAMKQMDHLDKKALLVFEEEEFINILSIGDIQRAILNSQDLNSAISGVIRKKTKLATQDMSKAEIKALMKEFRMEISSNHITPKQNPR